MRTVWTVAIIIVLCAVAGGWYFHQDGPPPVQFQTDTLQRGNLNTTISATGTLEPQEVVDVGAQVEGQLDCFGKDPRQADHVIDYGSQVKAGQVLAHVDDALYVADVDTAKAAVAQAKAGVHKAQADLGQLQAKLAQADDDWKRAQELGANSGLAASAIDTYRTTYQAAQANLIDGKAAIEVAQTGVEAAQAALEKSQKSLGYCTITSPVDGTVIDRRMNMGQTVVAALNAPSLFLIAKDLKKMQVWAPVNEADIGHIHKGQKVTFTVDAFPDQMFEGAVGKVRLNASMTQNVVTYTVEINTDNSSGKLLPYLTANVVFHLDQRTNVLMAPNSALRWSPQENEMSPKTQAAMDQTSAAPPNGSGRDMGTLWVPDGQFVKPVHVRMGVSDGTNTEIKLVEGSDKLSSGSAVVVGEVDPNDATATSNPFLPHFGHHKKKK